MTGPLFDAHWNAVHGVLLNTLRITDAYELTRIAIEFASSRLLELQAQPLLGQFNSAHLQAIHHYIYQDIFPWAGEFRTVTTARGEGASFPPPVFIAPSLDRIFNALANENYLRDLDREVFARRAAYYLGEINAVHGFRDGNGRAQREFIRTVAVGARYRLTWSRLTSDEINSASRLHFHKGDASALEALILPRLS